MRCSLCLILAVVGLLLPSVSYLDAADPTPRARVAVGLFKVPDNLKGVTANTLSDILREFGAGGLRHEAVPSTDVLKEVIDRIDTDGKLTRKPAEATGKAARFVLLPTVSGGDADGYLMTATVYDLRTGASRVVTVEEKGAGKGTRIDRLRMLALELWRQFDAPALKASFKPLGSVDLLAWSPDGKLLAIGKKDKTTEVWNADGILKATLKHNSMVRTVAWSPDGKLLATAWDDYTVKVWGVDGTIKATLELGGQKTAWSPDGKLLATASVNTAKVWGVDGTFKAALNHKGEVTSMAWSPDSKLLATGSYDSTARVWVADGTLKTKIKHVNGVWLVAWSPDGKLLTTGSMDNTVRLWDTNGELKAASSHDNKDKDIRSISWSPDGKLLASGSQDKTVKVWYPDGSLKFTLKHDAEVESVAWSPDGKLLATGSVQSSLNERSGLEDNNIKVWAVDGTLVVTLKHMSGFFMEWSPDGKLATVSIDDKVNVWDFSPPK